MVLVCLFTMTPYHPTLFKAGTYWQVSVVTLKWDVAGKSKPPPTGCNLTGIGCWTNKPCKKQSSPDFIWGFPMAGGPCRQCQALDQQCCSKATLPTSFQKGIFSELSATSERPQSSSGLCSPPGCQLSLPLVGQSLTVLS